MVKITKTAKKAVIVSDFFILKKMLYKTFQIECILVTFKLFCSIINFLERVKNSQKSDFGKICPPSKIIFFNKSDQYQNICINFEVFCEPFFSERKKLKNNRHFGRFRHFQYLAKEIYIKNSEDGSRARGTPLASM